MTSNEVITGKRKRVSKNKKKSWRKHSDIKDVEEFMEDQRMQERTGGLVAEKTNEELFFVEKKVKEEDGSSGRRKRRREPKPLKCHALLEGDPRIKPVRLTEHEKTNNVKRKCPENQVKIRTGALSKTQTIGLQQRKQAKQQRVSRFKERRKTQNADYDLWATDKKQDTDNIDEHYLKVMKIMKPKAPSLYLKKPSGLPAVEVAHPGASYNPTYVDHQELLQKALVVEIIKDKKEKRIERALDAQFPTVDQAPTIKTWLEEMGSGLFDEEKGEESEDNNSGTESDKDDSGEEEGDRLSVNPPVRREDKKTVKQRRKDKEKKEKEKLLNKEKSQKINKNEVFRLKSIKKGVKEREEELKKRQAKKAWLEEKYKDNTKKLGKLKYEEPSLEIKLSDEVEGSLRLLKPEGHLLNDRFKSLQKRNMLEARDRAKVVKKYKRKKFEKKSHKEITA